MQKSTLMTCCDAESITDRRNSEQLLNVTENLKMASCFFIHRNKQDLAHINFNYLCIYFSIQAVPPLLIGPLNYIWETSGIKILRQHIFISFFRFQVYQPSKSRKKQQQKKKNQSWCKIKSHFSDYHNQARQVYYLSVIKILSGSIPVTDTPTRTPTHTHTTSLCTQTRRSAQCYSWQLRA